MIAAILAAVLRLHVGPSVHQAIVDLKQAIAAKEGDPEPKWDALVNAMAVNLPLDRLRSMSETKAANWLGKRIGSKYGDDVYVSPEGSRFAWGNRQHTLFVVWIEAANVMGAHNAVFWRDSNRWSAQMLDRGEGSGTILGDIGTTGPFLCLLGGFWGGGNYTEGGSEVWKLSHGVWKCADRRMCEFEAAYVPHRPKTGVVPTILWLRRYPAVLKQSHVGPLIRVYYKCAFSGGRYHWSRLHIPETGLSVASRMACAAKAGKRAAVEALSATPSLGRRAYKFLRNLDYPEAGGDELGRVILIGDEPPYRSFTFRKVKGHLRLVAMGRAK